MNKKIIAKNGKLTTPLICLLVAGNLVGCEVDKEEQTFDLNSYRVTANVGDGGKSSHSAIKRCFCRKTFNP